MARAFQQALAGDDGLGGAVVPAAEAAVIQQVVDHSSLVPGIFGLEK
jgi:orotidine-5'-phosphate decarboxylase